MHSCYQRFAGAATAVLSAGPCRPWLPPHAHLTQSHLDPGGHCARRHCVRADACARCSLESRVRCRMVRAGVLLRREEAGRTGRAPIARRVRILRTTGGNFSRPRYRTDADIEKILDPENPQRARESAASAVPTKKTSMRSHGSFPIRDMAGVTGASRLRLSTLMAIRTRPASRARSGESGYRQSVLPGGGLLDGMAWTRTSRVAPREVCERRHARRRVHRSVLLASGARSAIPQTTTNVTVSVLSREATSSLKMRTAASRMTTRFASILIHASKAC